MHQALPKAELLPSLYFPLIKRFYREYYPSGKPNKADPIWVLRYGSEMLSVARLKQLGEYQLLTGMVTAPLHRKKGLASHLLKSMHSSLASKHCYCFVHPQLVEFYLKCDFILIEATELPEALGSRLHAYTAHGRELIALKYSPNRATKPSKLI